MRVRIETRLRLVNSVPDKAFEGREDGYPETHWPNQAFNCYTASNLT